MMIKNRCTSRVLRTFGAGTLHLLVVFLAWACLLTAVSADQTSDVPAVAAPSDVQRQGEPGSNGQSGKVEEDGQKVVPPPKSIQKKSTGYPSFYPGDSTVKGQIRSSERSINQSTRSLNDSVRRMNDSINRMRYLPKRF